MTRTLHIVVFILLINVLSSCEWYQNRERALVVGKIQTVSKLVTTEFTVDKIVHGTKTRKIAWLIKLNETQFLAHSKARIKTGIDLSKMDPDKIFIQDRRIDLTLPGVEVVNFSYPPEDFELDTLVSDVKDFANTINIGDQEEFFRKAELDIRNNIQYMGIVETTQKNAKVLLRGLLTALSYEEINISFENDELKIDRVNLNQSED